MSSGHRDLIEMAPMDEEEELDVVGDLSAALGAGDEEETDPDDDP